MWRPTVNTKSHNRIHFTTLRQKVISEEHSGPHVYFGSPIPIVNDITAGHVVVNFHARRKFTVVFHGFSEKTAAWLHTVRRVDVSMPRYQKRSIKEQTGLRRLKTRQAFSVNVFTVEFMGPMLYDGPKNGGRRFLELAHIHVSSVCLVWKRGVSISLWDIRLHRYVLSTESVRSFCRISRLSRCDTYGMGYKWITWTSQLKGYNLISYNFIRILPLVIPTE